MPDFGVLKGIKSVLQSDEAIQNQGMDKKIYLTIPPQSSAPAVLIELEEVWSSIAMSRAAPQAKIKLRTSIVGEQGKKYLPVYIADHLQKIMDGLSLNLEDGKIMKSVFTK